MTSTHTHEELEAALLGLYPLIEKAAKSVAFQWPGIVEEDDMVQKIALYLWENQGSMMRVASVPNETDRYKAIVYWGHRLAREERDDYDHFTGAYRYSVDEVKSLLTRGVLTEPVEGFNEAVFDLLEALEALITKTPQYVDAVTSRYADGIVPKTGAKKMQLSDALSSLADAMNRSNRNRSGGEI